MEFTHVPVLLDDCINGLRINPDGIYVDGTAGGAGHSAEIAKRLTGGRLYALDRDPDAVAVAGERLKGLNAEVIRCNYSEMDEVLKERGINGVDGILLDLGVSSHQLDTAERGFSYHADAPLDMRMSQEGTSAEDILNTWSAKELTKILYEYGEEKFAPRIATGIISYRESNPLKTTGQLAEIIRNSVPAAVRREKNPCKKTFQAVRIAVNCEFEHLDRGLDAAFSMLNSGGRLCVITFHSLEDRIVKQRFASWCVGCTCPPEFPVCICENKPKGRLINKKPIIAEENELSDNNRSRSAKLRIIEKI